MNRFLVILLLVAASTRLIAQSTPPAKLAVLALSQDAAPIGDLLTAELSSNPKVAVLERNEIEKVYREQALSQANKDYLKLGQVLGADGLLLLDARQRPRPNLGFAPIAAPSPPLDLKVRLIAVKTCILLSAQTISLSANDFPDWTKHYADNLNPLLSKLTLERADAVPISLVNLRSATLSEQSAEEERQLKALMIERLTRERQLIVLERQRMQSLAEEKALNLDESAFWAGSYLLDGIIDPDGYNKETITVRIKLTPPKGGAPISADVSGPRNDLGGIVNQLAAAVVKGLNIKNAAPAWNPAEEAAQYFNETKWALRWGIVPEAQAAAESAWALGKKDTECGLLRVQSYLAAIPDVLPPGQKHFSMFAGNIINDANIDAPPNPANCGDALRAVEIYNEGLVSGIGATPFVDLRHNIYGKKDKLDWYSFGVEVLNAASSVLYHYHAHPALERAAAEKLAALRAEIRRAAAGIAAVPAVRAQYFVGKKIVSIDDLHHFTEDSRNFYFCEAKWGCFWQERPEDTIAIYRELASSPMFAHVHQLLWVRPLEAPRLVGWNAEQRAQIPGLWRDFVRELRDSPDLPHQLEAKAFEVADSTGQQKLAGFVDLFHELTNNKDILLTNNIPVFANAWELGALAPPYPASEMFSKDYRPQLHALNDQYIYYSAPAMEFAVTFEKQKQYLAEKRPYDFEEFSRLFPPRNYSKAQALELQPLLTAYIADLNAKSAQATQSEKARLFANLSFVRSFQTLINFAINPPVAPRPPLAKAGPPTRPPGQDARLPAPPAAAIGSNILAVTRFLEIPFAGLPSNSGENMEFGGSAIIAHHWDDGKLVLDLQYAVFANSFDKNANWAGTRYSSCPAVAILDPASGHWDVVNFAEVGFTSESPYYDHTALWRGRLFTCNGQKIERYDFDTKTWNVLDVSDGNNCELFNVNGHLYGANDVVVFEILGGGKSTRLLASARREPPMSALDRQPLGIPALFEGPGHSLRIHTGEKVFSWTGSDWREDGLWPDNMAVMPFFAKAHAQFSPDGTLFEGASIWRFPAGSLQAEICLEPPSRDRSSILGPMIAAPRPAGKPLWETPRKLVLGKATATWHQTNLYLLEDHSTRRDIVDEERHIIIGAQIETRDGYHAILHCFEPGLARPLNIPLRFDAPRANPPVPDLGGWMLAAGDWLFLGHDSVPMAVQPVQPSRDQCRTGVWAVPLAELRPLLAAAQKEESAREAIGSADKTEAAKKLLAQYDANHDGVIEPDEKEAMIKDPEFLVSELPNIDANHNGILDADELRYFDVNKNGILDENEEQAVDASISLFADKMMIDITGDPDGDLNPMNLPEVLYRQVGRFPTNRAMLVTSMRQHLINQLGWSAMSHRPRPSSTNGPPRMFRPMGMPDFGMGSLKGRVEAYWRSEADRPSNKPEKPPPP